MPNPTAAMLVIGDEILSGRTLDANLNHLAGQLAAHGIDLEEARFVRDVHEQIAGAVNELRKSWDHVFTTGGIGPTHDDITADAVAAAFGVDIGVRADARALLDEHCRSLGLELNEGRLRMARVPGDARLIANSVSAAPGFSIDNVHVMAGVPKIFQAMLREVLKTLPGGTPQVSKSLELNTVESELAGPLGDIADRFSDLQIGSYPFRTPTRRGVNVVIKGTDRARVISAEAEARLAFAEFLDG